jgi:hypothetical protein
MRHPVGLPYFLRFLAVIMFLSADDIYSREDEEYIGPITRGLLPDFKFTSLSSDFANVLDPIAVLKLQMSTEGHQACSFVLQPSFIVAPCLLTTILNHHQLLQ